MALAPTEERSERCRPRAFDDSGVHHMSTLLDPQSNLLHEAAVPHLEWQEKKDRPVALIFRMRLLAFSETFIRSQADAMKTFRPFFSA